MKKRIRIASIALLALVMGACTTQGPNEGAGMVIGGILGGVLGHQVGDGHGRAAATIAGTLAGAAIGGAIGQRLDDVDRMKMNASLETVRTGVSSRWTNPDTRHAYEFTPTRTYETSTGPCREFRLDAEIGSGTEALYGRACRQADGSWRILETH